MTNIDVAGLAVTAVTLLALWSANRRWTAAPAYAVCAAGGWLVFWVAADLLVLLPLAVAQLLWSLARWLQAMRGDRTPFGWVPWTVEIGDQVCCRGQVPVEVVGQARDAMLAALRQVADKWVCTGPQAPTVTAVDVAEAHDKATRGDAMPDPLALFKDAPERCGECGGVGALIDWGPASAIVPGGAVPVERCDSCGVFESDDDAAVGVAADWFTETDVVPANDPNRPGAEVFCVYLPPAPTRIETWDGRRLYVNELGWVVEEVDEDQPEAG